MMRSTRRLTIVYEAVVANVPGNDRGALRTNTATLAWTAAGDAASVSDTADAVRIVEPVLTLGKTAAPSTGDAGDEIAFTLTIANPTATEASTAFDVTLTDVIPAGLVYVVGSLQHTAGAAPTSLGETGGTITATWTSLPPGTGGSSTITFSATLAATVAPGQSIVNTGALDWSSLPGAVTTAQSPYEPASTERTGVESDPGGTQNDHRTTAQATVTVPVAAPVKTIVDTSESTTTTPRVAVGEIVRYRIAWVIPEGTSTDLRIVDELPSGLRYVPGATTKVALISDGADLTSSTLSGPGLAIDGSAVTAPTFSLPTTSVTPSTFTDGTDPVFLLGTVTNPDSDANAEYVVVEFNALVLNVQGNQIDQNRDNSAGVRAGGSASNLATSTGARVTVAEPVMTLTKTLTTAPLQAGDPVVYTISIANGTGTNATTAFDVRVTDTLDPNLTLDGLTVSPTTGVTDATSGSVLDLTIASIAPGADVHHHRGCHGRPGRARVPDHRQSGRRDLDQPAGYERHHHERDRLLDPRCPGRRRRRASGSEHDAQRLSGRRIRLHHARRSEDRQAASHAGKLPRRLGRGLLDRGDRAQRHDPQCVGDRYAARGHALCRGDGHGGRIDVRRNRGHHAHGHWRRDGR